MINALIVFLTVFFSILALAFLNDIIGTRSGSDKVYKGQKWSGGSRLIIDGYISEKSVLTMFGISLIISISFSIATIILVNFNFFIILIILFGYFVLFTHDWLKRKGLILIVSIPSFLMMLVVYYAVVDHFPNVLEIAILLAVYSNMWVINNLNDASDYPTDKVTGKRTLLVRFGFIKIKIIDIIYLVISIIIYLYAIYMDIVSLIFAFTFIVAATCLTIVWLLFGKTPNEDNEKEKIRKINIFFGIALVAEFIAFHVAFFL